MTKAFFLFLFTITGFVSFAKSGKIVISGQVKNQSATSISIADFNYKNLASSGLDNEGNFKMTARLNDGYYLLTYGRYTSYVYLNPKDDLTIIFDANYFKSTLSFEGRGSSRNNYLAKKALVASQFTSDFEAFYSKDQGLYLKNLENLKNTHLRSLSTYDVEDFFIEAETKSLEYARLLAIQNYESNYKFYLGEEISVSEDFTSLAKEIGSYDADDYKKQPYYRYLVNSYWNDRIDSAPSVNSMLDVFRQVPSQDLMITLINGLYSKISSNKDRSKDYLDLIKLITNYQPFIEAAEEKYRETLESKSLERGDASPGFSYESINGDNISLKDLKGKYVYIDVWATWCSPCLKQVTYLKKLEAHFEDKNIVFVSISVDKREFKAVWKQMIADKELGGLQLFADNSFDSEFMNAYAVNSIPRFILIDPDGNILESEAPRPSYQKTTDLLEQLLR